MPNLNPPCFWFAEGKCQLPTTPCDIVLYMIRSNARARQGILHPCPSCPPPDQFYVDYATKVGSFVDPQKENDDYTRQSARNNYRDNQRLTTAYWPKGKPGT